MSSAAGSSVVLISTVGQIFCGMACVTSASRMTFAFSRDGAVPGSQPVAAPRPNKTPTWSALFVVAVRADHHDPGVLPEPPRQRRSRSSRSPRSRVIGLYIAYIDPDVPALADGRQVRAGPWTLGNKYKWMNPVAVRSGSAICVVIFCLPFAPAGVPSGVGLRLVGWSTTRRS